MRPVILSLFMFFLSSAAILHGQITNDNLCDAMPLTIGAACGDASNIDVTGATAEPNEPSLDCGSFFELPTISNSVWYSFVATDQSLFVQAVADEFNTLKNFQLQLFTLGGDCSDLSTLQLVQCAIGGDLIYNPSMKLEGLVEGTTYYLQVSGLTSAFAFPPAPYEGTGCLTISEIVPPANDNVCDAIDLTIDGPAQIFSNLDATVEEGEALVTPPFSMGFGGFETGGWNLFSAIDKSVWFTFTTPEEGGDIAIDLLGSNQLPGGFDTQLAVYRVDDCNDFSSFEFVDGSDNSFPEGFGLFSMNSKLTLYCQPGNTTYYVLVDGGSFPFFASEIEGFFSIQVTNPDPVPITFNSQLESPDCAGDNNGSILIGVNGGAGLYTYEWSTGDTDPELINSLGAGTYTLTVTDQCGVSYSESFVLDPGKYNDLSSSAGEDIVACLGDEVPLSVSATGGSLIDSKRMFTLRFGPFNPDAPENKLLKNNIYFPETGQDTIDSAFGLSFTAMEFVGDQLYAVDSDNVLYQVNSSTGATTPVGTIDVALRDLSYITSTGQLLGTTSSGEIYTIDQTNASASLLFTIPNTSFIIQSAIDQNGVIYAIIELVDENENFETKFQGYDINTGELLNSADFTVNSLGYRAMEVDPYDNKLYVMISRSITIGGTSWQSLVELDKVTGERIISYNDFGNSTPVTFAIQPRSVEPYTYSWSPAGALDDPTSANPVFTMDQATTFTVTTTDACGNSSTSTVAVEQQMENCPVDIELSISVDNSLYNQYEHVMYTITVSNQGFNPASGVTVSAELPDGMVYSSDFASQGSYELFFEMWEVGTLAAGQTETLNLELFTLIGEVEIDNFVQVMTTNEPDLDSTPGNGLDSPDSEDDEAKITIKPASDGGIGTGIGSADLSLAINSESSSYENFEHINVVYTLTNDGPDDATGITVSLPEPNNAKYAGELNPVSASTGTFNLFYETWTIDNLPSGASANLTLDVFTLGENEDITCFAQVFIVNENDPDSSPANNSGQTPAEDDEASLVLQASDNSQSFLQVNNTVSAAANSYRLFPNPTSDELTITVNKSVAFGGNYAVLSVDGKVMQTNEYEFIEGYNELKLDVSNLENGMYFIQFEEENGNVQHLRFTKMTK